jgi:putative ABC transport system permease protein
MYGSVGSQMILIFGAAGLVLLIACGNVASLQLARATGRQTEIAVRASLGAGRGRVVRQLLTESSLLSLVGGGAGVLLAIWSLGIFRGLIPPTIPRADQIAVDGPVLLFALILSLLTGIIFGLAPAMTASRANLTASLKAGGGKGDQGSPRKERLRTAFVAAQFALCLILLNGGLLLLRSWVTLRNTETGFDRENVLTMALSLGDERFPSDWERSVFVEEVLESISTLPGVETAGAATKLPLLGGNNNRARADHEAPRDRPREGWMVEVSAFLPDYHRAMGIPLLAGRMLTASDTMAGEQNVVINKAMADRMWPDQDPLGRRFTFSEDPPHWHTVVGVVGDVRQVGLETRPRSEMYSHYAAGGRRQIFLTLKTTADPAPLVPAVRARVLSIDPEQPVSEIRTMEQIIATSLERRSFFTLMTGFFALFAVTLATVGIYGVISYFVAQRTHEIGVRIAMGAARKGVLGLVVRRGAKVVVYGLAFGVGGALASGAIVASILFGVSALEPVTLTGTALVLSSMVILGSIVPALRATRVSPLTALRSE